MDIRAVIMAGGAGTRFWPLSRKKRPKQFLPIISRKTMIEETVERLLPLIPFRNILTIAGRSQTQLIKKAVPRIPEKNLLVEPQGKNTAPSLILATASIYIQNPQAVIIALPSDHLIKDNVQFLKKLEAAAYAADRGENLVTFGIPAAYPATGYGYIHYSRKNPFEVSGEAFFSVLGFKEKPAYEQARLFLEEGNYFWNSGMFLWRADVFARKIRDYAPSFFPFWERMVDALRRKDKSPAGAIASIFHEMPSISIDYALMEKARGVLVGEGSFGWSDVGSWSSLVEIWEKDTCGNAFKGEGVILDSQNCIYYNPGKLTALVGVKDIVVINTRDALLICHKGQDQKVKDVIEILKKKGNKKYL
ncbi:MAG: sugar phosphate nucleotidyltransferase [Candidatus Aminicenantales bacterium]